MSALEFGAGALVAVGLSGMPEASPSSYTLPRSRDAVSESSYSGLAYGAGVEVEARLFELLGLGVAAVYRRDSATGTVTRAGSESELALSQAALHLPIVLKAHWQLEPLSPFVLAGAELVVPGLSTAEVEPAGAHGAVAAADSHTFLLVGAGAELASELVGALRPAASLSFGFRPSASEKLAERLTVLPSDAVVYDSAFAWQVTLQAGALYFW